MTSTMTRTIVRACAQAAHEVNREYCVALGDFSQVDWLVAPEWQRVSAIKGAEFVLANPDASPSAGHDSWLAEKNAEGWIYGPTKDAEKKTHPCMVPFENLPIEQQMKDTLFRSTVLGVAAHWSEQ